MKIYAPVKDTNGVYASVRFINGVGETDDPYLIEWFRKHGYKVQKEDSTLVNEPTNLIIETTNDQIETPTDEVKPDFDAMNPLELREWMRNNGYGSQIRNTRNKEKLLEILRG